MSNAVLTPLEPAAVKPGAALRILPAGAFRTIDGRPGNLPDSPIHDWRIDATIAAQAIAVPPPNGNSFVIDYEHQTLLKEKNGKPAPAAGWFKRLEWREGQGLFMTDIEWTSSAKKMIIESEYRFLSPVFRFNPKTGDITSIHSVALTNEPALVGLGDLAAATAQSVYAPATEVLTAEDRANFTHVFGGVPGFNLPALPAQAAASASACHDLPSMPFVMSEQDRANIIHAFGWDPTADLRHADMVR